MLVVTRRLLDLFAERRLFHRVGSGERWRVGDRLRVHPQCEIEPYSHIHQGFAIPRRLGAFTYSHSPLHPAVSIGRYGSIASRVTWMGDTHPVAWASTSPFSYDPRPLQGFRAYLVEDLKLKSFPLKTFGSAPAAVSIGHDVWIGEDAMFKGGVTVGDGAVIGARSLVTKDVPPYAIVGGSPARVIRMRFPEALIERLLQAQWWRFGPDVLQPLGVEEPERFLDNLAQVEADRRPLELTPLRYEEMREVAEG